MPKKKTKVLVFGYFGKQSHVQEGQSVKTRNMSRLFKEMGCSVEGKRVRDATLLSIFQFFTFAARI